MNLKKKWDDWKRLDRKQDMWKVAAGVAVYVTVLVALDTATYYAAVKALKD